MSFLLNFLCGFALFLLNFLNNNGIKIFLSIVYTPDRSMSQRVKAHLCSNNTTIAYCEILLSAKQRAGIHCFLLC